MMRSLYAGISGLRNHQTRMDVIGNNIANVNTVGFKGSRVNFQDMLSQTMQGASGASGERGGTNPMQIGMGMGVASIDTLFTDGSFQSTGKQTDLAISGQGFFVLTDGTNQVYTRAGAFDFDTVGNFLVPGTGYKVTGWTADAFGNINTSSTAAPIQIPVGQQMSAKPSTSIDYANNLSASDPVGTTILSSINVYDSLGNAQKVNQTFVKESDNSWLASTNVPGSTITAGGISQILFNSNGTLNTVKSVTAAPIPTATVTIPALQLNNTLSSADSANYTVFDSNNIPHEVKVTFTNTAPNAWSYKVSDLATPNAADLTLGTMSFDGATSSYTGFPISFKLAGETNAVSINAPANQINPIIGNFAGAGVATNGAAGPINGIVTLNGLQLNGDTTSSATTTNKISTTVADASGASHPLDITFTATGTNTWSYVIHDTGANAGADVTGTMTYDPSTGAYSPLTSYVGAAGAATGTIDFAFGTGANVPVAPNSLNATIATGVSPYTTTAPTSLSFKPPGGANDVTLSLNMGNLVQYGGASTAGAVNQDGYASGSLEKTSINTSGVIIGQFSNGQTLSLAQVALANFNNPSGLGKVGESLYVKTTNSGEPQVGAAGSGGRGGFNAGSLEMSNVDLAQQFSDMIVTQRGFQANSKIITTTDSMLEELVNLKR